MSKILWVGLNGGKFIAAFYDKEAEADKLFDEMVERYNEVKALTADLTEKKTVLINTAYEGTWYMPVWTALPPF